MPKQQALVIDDNKLNSEVIATLLEDADFSVISISLVRQLQSALDSLNNLQVVFLDLEMPTRSGFEIQQELRADRRFDGIPVIAYSVHTSEIDVVRRAGFDGFLGKPIHPERFSTQLSRILNGEQVWDVGA